jgi:hypothetical protein
MQHDGLNIFCWLATRCAPLLVWLQGYLGIQGPLKFESVQSIAINSVEKWITCAVRKRVYFTAYLNVLRAELPDNGKADHHDSPRQRCVTCSVGGCVWLHCMLVCMSDGVGLANNNFTEPASPGNTRRPSCSHRIPRKFHVSTSAAQLFLLCHHNLSAAAARCFFGWSTPSRKVTKGWIA